MHADPPPGQLKPARGFAIVTQLPEDPVTALRETAADVVANPILWKLENSIQKLENCFDYYWLIIRQPNPLRFTAVIEDCFSGA